MFFFVVWRRSYSRRELAASVFILFNRTNTLSSCEKIFIDLNLELTNIIQQKDLVFAVIMLRYKVRSFFLWMIVGHGNHMGSTVNMQKQNDKVNMFEVIRPFLEKYHQFLFSVCFCSFRLIMFFNIFLVIVYTFY